MSRVRAFFLREGSECLEAARAELESAAVDMAGVHRAVRQFRGSAQMARFGALAEAALELERRLRPPREGQPAAAAPGPAGERGGDRVEELRRDIGQVLDSLERGMEAIREGRLEEDPRMETDMEGQGVREGGDALEAVPVETLEYRGKDALTRALELRESLETAIVSEESVTPVLDELFDLIRLGAK